MTQHTPGPWRVVHTADDRAFIDTEESNDNFITQVDRNVPEYEENAAYIVRACNAHEELLEALQDCLTSDESVGVRMKDPEKLIRRLHVINDRVNEAIAKAEGNNTHA